MKGHDEQRTCGVWSWALIALSCAPASDLDLHARGGGPVASLPDMSASDTDSMSPGATGETPPGSTAAEPSTSAGGRDDNGFGDPVALDVDTPTGAADAGAAGAPPGIGGDGGTGVPEPEPPLVEPPLPVPAPDLPDDLIAAPVSGEIEFSDDAVWEVDAVFEPTFEIHTPTASYWVVKPLGTIVSIMDRAATPAQWIDFSSGFRPSRGVPSFSTPPATRVTTVRDDESQTPTHVRLTSESGDAEWQWVWDFYVTHATFTVNRAPVPHGFAYQGVPGGSLGPEDRLVLSDGVAQGARSSFNGELPGPAEWAYIADTALGRSIFAIQHRDDNLAERYQVRDNDTSLLSFGNGQSVVLPARFSLGIIPSVSHAAVTERVEFVVGAIR